jgi:flagellin
VHAARSRNPRSTQRLRRVARGLLQERSVTGQPAASRRGAQGARVVGASEIRADAFGAGSASSPVIGGQGPSRKKENTMGLRINTNTSSINAQRNLTQSTEALARSLERLSSGLRITRASDDAAGLAISERLRSQVRSYQQAQRNSLDGISLLQVAEGALNESSGILVRLRELAVQSANGTLGANERAAVNAEFQDLIGEIDRIAAVTEFNGTLLLDGSAPTVTFQVGVNNTANDQISITGVDATATGIGVNALLVDTQANAQAALATLDTAINTVTSLRSTFGTAQNRLESTIRSIAVAVENTTAAESRIRDVDVASETAALTRAQVLQQAGIAVLAQANVSTQNALALLRG